MLIFISFFLKALP